MTLERKYGDSLNFEDLHGYPGKPRKKKSLDEDELSKSPVNSNNITSKANLLPGQSSVDKEPETKVVKKYSDKRKEDTDCKNDEFETLLKYREQNDPDDFHAKNISKLRAMSTGRPLKERLYIPDDVEVFVYGNQKLNIWEVQKEELRQKITNDTGKFYTYSKDFLSLSFPLVNENEIAVKAKEENEARWKTKSGFDNVMKRENWNEHPKKPHPATCDGLKVPYHEQVKETKEKMKAHQFKASENKPDFYGKVKGIDTFSNKEYFKTVFTCMGDDAEREERERKQKEIDDFNNKVVVKNKHFSVYTREKVTAD